jgi:hypothetical protein
LAAVGAVVVAVLAVTATGRGAVLRPRAAAVGVAGAVSLEVLFLRYPDRLLPLWEQRGVPTGSLFLVITSGAVSVRYVPWLLGALCWGFGTYLALLASVSAGFGNPLSVVSGGDTGARAAEDRE